jgi:Trk K+ transport system NAD-binding subunit
MARTSDLDRVSMIVLRYMRRPVFVLVFVYAVGIFGMALIPGLPVDGEPRRMSLFHAFYFFTYTATTTGFGEIPGDFSDEQRLWAIVCLYFGVIAWLYAIGSVIGLIQNPHFLSALNERRLARLVRRISEPYFLICGFGDTGSLLARGLSDHDLGAVVLDTDQERIKALALRDYNIRMPGLCADASVPKHLVDAGVREPNCKAVLILTGDEDTNLKIAVMARYLNPRVRILCRSSSARHQEHLRGLEAVTIIDPFEVLARLVTLAVTRPNLQNLNRWLVRARGTDLGRAQKMAKGRWLICGYGRLGRSLQEHFVAHGIETCIIDAKAEQARDCGEVVMCDADYRTLRDSGVEEAVGIVAGTDLDSTNLGILMGARRLNPDVFTVVRQNSHENQPVFDAAHASYIVQTSLTTARRILKYLISPLIQTLIDHLARSDPRETQAAIRRLRRVIGDAPPHLWQFSVCGADALALCERLDAGEPVTLRDLVRNPDDRERSLRCVPLVVQRSGGTHMLPADDEPVRRDDQILLCGTERSKRLLEASVNNGYTLHYLLTGVDPPRGYVFRWVAERSTR